MTMNYCQVLPQSHVSWGHNMEEPPSAGLQCVAGAHWGIKLSFLTRKSAAKTKGKPCRCGTHSSLQSLHDTAHPSEPKKWTEALT